MMEDTKKYISEEELKKHNKPGDVWISIKGKVYDVTKWLKEHPGGDVPIMNLAGQDATDAFIAYHPGSAFKYLDGLFTGFHLQDYQVSEVSKDYRNLVSEFAKAGLFNNKGHTVIYCHTFVALLLAGSVYGVLGSDSFSVHMLSAALLGMCWIQAAYLGHDSGHYNIMTTKGYNKLAQILNGNCLTGISIAWWKWTHNAHHVSCNSLDYDPDIQHLPVFAVSSGFFKSITSKFYGRKLTFDRVSRALVSYQHFTYYPIMVVARLNLYLQTFLLLFSTRRVPDRALNIAGILVFWTWFPYLVSCLPCNERLLFIVVCFTVTSLQHIQFTLNHFAANVYEGPPTGNDWFEKQTSGTIDISCASWMDWLFGGLQFQLEHHLFPRMPRCQLRRISPIIQDYCKKHNLPYRSLTFFEANVATLRTLRTAALEARENLLWEAVNTVG